MKLQSATIEMNLIGEDGLGKIVTARLIGTDNSEVLVNHDSPMTESDEGWCIVMTPSDIHNFDFTFTNVRIANGHSS